MGILSRILPKMSTQIAKTYVCQNAFNKAGNIIFRSESVTARRSLKELHAPKQAVKAEILEVEKNFGKDKVRVVSFKDKDNQLISRISQNGATETNSTYKLDRDIYEVSRKTSENGKLQVTLHSTILKTRKNSNAVLRTEEIGNGSRHEVQRIIDGEKELVTTGTRFADGSTKLESITGKNITDLDAFKNDPYIMIRNYTNSDFVESVVEMLSKRFNLKKKPKLNIHTKRAGNTLGKFTPARNLVNIYGINERLKPDLADTVAHELRHAKQYETGLFKLLKKLILGKKYSVHELKMEKFFVKEDILYPHLYDVPLLNKLRFLKKAYWKNGLEVDARKWGNKMQQEYRRYTTKMEKNMNKNLLGDSDNTFADFLYGLKATPHKTVKLGPEIMLST